MSQPFDISMKDLIERDPTGWAQSFSPEPVLSAEVIQSDTSALSAADKVLRVQVASGTFLLNIEPQSSYDARLAERLQFYSSVLSWRENLPVRSVALLLRREANVPALQGTLTRRCPGEPSEYLTFHYQVMRVWAQPEAPFLRGPLALLPLAALTDEAEPHLAETVEQSLQRIQQEAPASEASTIQLALFLLLGLRYDPAVTETLFLRAKAMQESSTYHWLKERQLRDEARGLREGMLHFGRKKLGEPPAAFLASLEQIDNHDRLRALADQVYEASSWDEITFDE